MTMTHNEILRTFGLPEMEYTETEYTETEYPTNVREESHATCLVSLAKQLGEFFHSPLGVAHVTVTKGEGRATWPVESRAFRNLLSFEFYQRYHDAPGQKAVADALNILDALARFTGPEHEVYVRIAEHQGRIYLDLGDDTYRAIEIDADGWRCTQNVPVRFWRPDSMTALPMPERGGHLGLLRQYLNVEESDLVLVLAWLTMTFHPHGPYPILNPLGEQGSAKSTAARVLKWLTDPTRPLLRAKPKDDEALMIGAKNNRVLAYDNLSHISDSLSDLMCQISTGGGYAARKKYTDDDENAIEVLRPQIINGIADVATRSDLLDRTIIVHLPPLVGNRLTEQEFNERFFADRPKILGFLLDGVVMALRNLPSVQLDNPPRMADFAKWSVAAEPAWGVAPGSFMRAYDDNREDIHLAVLDESSVARAVMAFMDGRTSWQGTASALYKTLTDTLGQFVRRPTDWPQGARGLSAALNRLAPNLRAAGIEVKTGQKSNGERLTVLTKRG